MLEIDHPDIVMPEALEKGTGINSVRRTGEHTGGVCRSFEVQIADGRFVYLEESRNYNEELIGYNLLFCLIDPKLPKELAPKQKEAIEKHFGTVIGDIPEKDQPTVWAAVSAPYTREEHPAYDKGQDWSQRCLWLDIKFLGMARIPFREVVAYLPSFRQTCEQFVFPVSEPSEEAFLQGLS